MTHVPTIAFWSFRLPLYPVRLRSYITTLMSTFVLFTNFALHRFCRHETPIDFHLIYPECTACKMNAADTTYSEQSSKDSTRLHKHVQYVSLGLACNDVLTANLDSSTKMRSTEIVVCTEDEAQFGIVVSDVSSLQHSFLAS